MRKIILINPRPIFHKLSEKGMNHVNQKKNYYYYYLNPRIMEVVSSNHSHFSLPVTYKIKFHCRVIK